MSDLLLCIDTVGARCAVAVYDRAAAVMLARAEPDIGRGHAERLFGLVAGVLDAAAAGYGDLSAIAVVVGPGSFTGLRVGVAAAKGLALALSIPAIGVTTLEALAEPHWHGEPAILAVIDAKRGEIYAALFDRGGAVLGTPRVLGPDGLGAFVEASAPRGRPLVAVGSGAEIARGVLGAGLSGTPASGDVPDLASVARIAASRDPSAGVRPLYLRGADAKPSAPTGLLKMTRRAILP